MSTNAFLKSWLYLLTTIYFSFAYEKLIQKAGRNKGFDDLYTYDGAIGVYDRHNVFECSNTCSDNVKCLSFFFHFELKTCILHPLPFWNSYPQQYQVGWRSYIAQDVSGRCPWSEELWYNRELDLCFKIHNPKRMFYPTDVKPLCSNENNTLIRIDSAEKNQYILDVLGHNFDGRNKICIQGTNQLTNDYSVWTFDDLTPMPYLNWDLKYEPSQPENMAGQGVVAIQNVEGTWHDYYEFYTAGSCYIVCEKRP